VFEIIPSKYIQTDWKFSETFLRTMENTSAADLDWFFRGWFYSTDFMRTYQDNDKKQYVLRDYFREIKNTK
jgi:hypothetical protein